MHTLCLKKQIVDAHALSKRVASQTYSLVQWSKHTLLLCKIVQKLCLTEQKQ